MAWAKSGSMRPPVILPAYAVAPANPVLGQKYFNTTTNQEQVWNGNAWQAPDANVGQQIAYAEASPGAYWLGSNYSANTGYLGPADGTFYNLPGVAVTVPAGQAAWIEAEVEMAPDLQGLAANVDIWWCMQIYDTVTPSTFTSDFVRISTGTAAEPTTGNVYFFKKLACGRYQPAQAVQRTYQVRVGASTTLNAGAAGTTAGVEIFSGSAFNTNIVNGIRAVAA